MLWGMSLVDGQKGSDRLETDLQTYPLRTLALVTRRGLGEGKEAVGEGSSEEWTRKRMHRGRLFIENRRQWPVLALFPPNTGIDGDVLWPYFTLGFMLMTRLPVILAKFNSRPNVWARSWIDGNGMDGGGMRVRSKVERCYQHRTLCWWKARGMVDGVKRSDGVEEESETWRTAAMVDGVGRSGEDNLAQCEDGTRVLIEGLQLDKYKILKGLSSSHGRRRHVAGRGCVHADARMWAMCAGWRARKEGVDGDVAGMRGRTSCREGSSYREDGGCTREQLKEGRAEGF
ncbi:hypothetical protein ARMSODRAFT_968764 [Armillaria solidipes]|uniref:Uncharacterized protein n=1 Tax=Armillaria solidipes TaxID=1076256 RepID=A0A2H3CTR1_9AGAR|nr:hypothetical protein ARMSODRAFT_968764 [Armillaria solidipes]